MDQQKIDQCLRELGVTPGALAAIRGAANFDDATAKLAALKQMVKTNFKRLALELHPDRNGGDAAKTELFKALVQVQKDVDVLEIRRAPPQPVYTPPTFQHVVISYYGTPSQGFHRPVTPSAASAATTAATMYPSGQVYVRFTRS